MKTKGLLIMFIILLYGLSIVSSVVVDADYAVTYPGKQAKVTVEVTNNEDFDIEGISISLDIGKIPFTTIGSSERSIDDIREGRDDTVSFTLRTATEISPGDYEIPYTIRYKNAESDEGEIYENDGSFGIRVSTETDLIFSAETKGEDTSNPIVENRGQISLEIINRGLGEIKSVIVEITPQGFELLSNNYVFVGSVDSDDTDLATFDVLFTQTNPVLKAKVTYKNFDNEDQENIISIPLKVYTKEEALKLGIIDKSNSSRYIMIILILLILWVIWRILEKRKKNKKKMGE